MTREEVAKKIAEHVQGTRPGDEYWCARCEQSWPCDASEVLPDALALLDLREGIEALYRQYKYEHAQQKDHPDEQVRLHAAIMEGTLFDLRNLLKPKPTTEKGASDGR